MINNLRREIMISTSDEIKLRAEIAREINIHYIKKDIEFSRMSRREASSMLANEIVDDAISKSLNIGVSK